MSTRTGVDNADAVPSMIGVVATCAQSSAR
jgi:hypothetical protein